MMIPRMQIVWAVLEAAKDAGDDTIVSVCRGLIEADRRGWRKYHCPADYRLVTAFYEMSREG
jgi:hypothetical protein